MGRDPVPSVSELFDFDDFPELNLPEDGLYLIVQLRNELLRLPFFLKHYRSIGVQHFLIIDNASTDGTSAFLEAQSDVTRFASSKAFKDCKALWPRALLNRYCMGHWVFLVDADEQFVYPGWPDVPFQHVLKFWADQKVEGVHAPLVDMYSDRPLREVEYQSETPFLDTCPFFDTTSTWVLFYEGSRLAPPFEIRGGVRGRLFGRPSKKKVGWLHDEIRHFCLKPSRAWSGLAFQRWAQRKLHGYIPREIPVLNKVPLLYWRPEYTENRGVHWVDSHTKLADDWGALLHFKFFQDFQERVEEEMERKQYYAEGHEYKTYFDGMQTILTSSPCYAGSRRFNTAADLHKAGLVRHTKELDAHLRRFQSEAAKLPLTFRATA
ncbi:hypothetical protein PsAD2_00072 [Pseudovibrio axinellae]|uniref:Glycosyl transferase family 2 n=1 Tax=Pseudovibrio axinellae TaxID=989403 RepID=A0A166B9M2_9HYPH|nr:glycosyltransferase family 2 protein [Pseudovibrio axinellae]KZL22047.1 hypothetical protein PsAD2_00072 [Pseudovibrio axinellae]SEQ57299.1 Glycosyl transferase family 2 [Pseudovibrio axinellae]